jgi:MFS family permease
VLIATALLFTVSALGSAVATSNLALVVARIVGGFGVGGALLIAPIYIAEIAPAERRGRLVSFNQLNIVLGFSAAFFSNYFLERFGYSWRWMLGVETIPAAIYLVLLFTVPRSPRWLVMRGHVDEARGVLQRIHGSGAEQELQDLRASLAREGTAARARPSELLQRRMRRAMTIGLGLGFFQQITGINAIFYYSTTIFAMAGADRDAALVQAILVGLVNVAFTLLAMRWIDRLGRRPLLMIGTSLMAVALFANAAAFHAATYRVDDGVVAKLEDQASSVELAAVRALMDREFPAEDELIAALEAAAPSAAAWIDVHRAELGMESLQVASRLVLAAILLYIAAFAISLGPVMWAMFSEIFPQRMRGLAISAAGFFNSFISFAVQQLFPRGLETLGPAGVFAFFGFFAVLAFLFSWRIVPETKGRSLEDLERELIR